MPPIPSNLSYRKLDKYGNETGYGIIVEKGANVTFSLCSGGEVQVILRPSILLMNKSMMPDVHASTDNDNCYLIKTFKSPNKILESDIVYYINLCILYSYTSSCHGRDSLLMKSFVLYICHKNEFLFTFIGFLLGIIGSKLANIL